MTVQQIDFGQTWVAKDPSRLVVSAPEQPAPALGRPDDLIAWLRQRSADHRPQFVDLAAVDGNEREAHAASGTGAGWTTPGFQSAIFEQIVSTIDVISERGSVVRSAISAGLKPR